MNQAATRVQAMWRGGKSRAACGTQHLPDSKWDRLPQSPQLAGSEFRALQLTALATGASQSVVESAVDIFDLQLIIDEAARNQMLQQVQVIQQLAAAKRRKRSQAAHELRAAKQIHEAAARIRATRRGSGASEMQSIETQQSPRPSGCHLKRSSVSPSRPRRPSPIKQRTALVRQGRSSPVRKRMSSATMQRYLSPVKQRTTSPLKSRTQQVACDSAWLAQSLSLLC